MQGALEGLEDGMSIRRILVENMSLTPVVCLLRLIHQVAAVQDWMIGL